MANIKYCPTCAKNKNSLMANISEKHAEYYAGFTACFFQEKLQNDTKCPMCGNEGLVDSGITEEDVDAIGIASNYNRQLLEEMIKLHNENIIEYELRMSQFRANNLQTQQIQQTEESKPKCPKCGSTNITTGQRGFSLLTGFWGSNKTVNRCANCGHMWKP